MQDAKTMGVAVMLVVLSAVIFSQVIRRSPKTALHKFETTLRVAEDQMMDPLILAGDRVVPLVIKRIRDRDMPKRIYAIGFLANGEYTEAVPTLENLVLDEQESVYVRVSALRALHHLVPDQGRSLSSQFDGRYDALGEMAQLILLCQQPEYRKRSYWDAFWRRHY